MKTILTAALLATAALPAAAAGLIEPAQPVVVQPEVLLDFGGNWQGGYVGFGVGYGDVDADGAGSLDGEGAIGGFTAGYDWDLGRTVGGVGIDYDFTDIDLGSGVSIDGILRVTARLGYDSGRNLYYGTAGYARAYTDGGGFGDSNGYFVGAGYEVLLTERVSAQAELLYHDFNDFETTVDADGTTLTLGLNYRF